MWAMTAALPLFLLLAAAARAKAPVVTASDPGPDRLVTRLATPDDVARLCRALDPPERLRPGGDAVERGEAEARADAEHDAAVAGRYEVTTGAGAPGRASGRLAGPAAAARSKKGTRDVMAEC